MTNAPQRPFRLVAVNAGVSDPSATKLLAERLALRVEANVQRDGRTVETLRLDLRELLPELSGALASGHLGPTFGKAVEALASADGIVAATPI